MAPEEIIVQPWDDLLEDERVQWTNLLTRLDLPPLSDAILGSGDTSDDPLLIARRLSSDPLLAGKVLAVANSAALGRVREVQSLEQAVVYLGTNLVKVIVAVYQLESLDGSGQEFPRDYFTHVRLWAAASSVFAYNIALNIKRPVASELGTAALLARLGALLFGVSAPAPDIRYLEIANDAGRLKLETNTWGLTSPVLSGQLARHWGLPESLCTLLERSWEPLFIEMADSDERLNLVLVATAVTLGLAVVSNQKFDARVVLDRANSSILKSNLKTLGILDKVLAACAAERMRRELTALLQN